ncbi:MAG: pyridoxamine 5'-phosphate oxidase family protein [Prevotellaceae bacterium]|nr:pyridoxamine 5'-phosphate oxidase family protein [Prevotellaceae bacterium]
MIDKNTTIKKQAERLHKKVRTFILTCVADDGYPLTKAVVPGKHREAIGELYFCTNTSSNFIGAIGKNGKGSVYFYRKVFFNWKGCNLKGHFEVVNNITLKQKYWIDFYKNAYPQKSYTDPDFCLIRFTPSSGRFYANFRVNDFTIKAGE